MPSDSPQNLIPGHVRTTLFGGCDQLHKSPFQLKRFKWEPAAPPRLKNKYPSIHEPFCISVTSDNAYYPQFRPAAPINILWFIAVFSRRLCRPDRIIGSYFGVHLKHFKCIGFAGDFGKTGKYTFSAGLRNDKISLQW